MRLFIARIQGFIKYKDLMGQLISRDLKLKYRRSVLGYLWSILNPLFIMVIMAIVFSHMFHQKNIPNYPVYLMSGQVLFNFMNISTHQALGAITGNAALLKKTYLPKYVFTVSKITSVDEPHYPTESRFVENSLVIVFSVSGESRDTIGHVMRFKEQNCQILSVTNTENCTIAKLSDYNLAYYVTYERLGVYDVTTQLPAMSIVERLGKKLYRYTSEGMSTLTKDKQSLEAMYRKGWQDAEKLVQWYRAAKAEA